MSRIRLVEIRNFRGIRRLAWRPAAGMNCLIGEGDSGKSTILDAVDLCLGARRTVAFTDTDFCSLDTDTPISVRVTLGDLPDTVKRLETYGPFLRGFDPLTGDVEDEPGRKRETVVTMSLQVTSDLEPNWSLFSDRAAAQDIVKDVTWSDRVLLAPTWIGTRVDYNMGWKRGSVLSSLTEERPNLAASLAKAARDARIAFGGEAEKQLGDTLNVVTETANELGISVGSKARALLDANSVSFTGGTITLHNETGIPLSGLGVGSARLLIAGLQRKASSRASIVLIDELEYGLEPHRIIRLLTSLGAKEASPPLQVFATTHSPAAIRELSGDQMFIVRKGETEHFCKAVGLSTDVQAATRLFPEALLANSIIVCEGASEVGLIRGLDHYRIANGEVSISAHGTALVDGGGSAQMFSRARAFQTLGYRTAVIRDDDVRPTPEKEAEFLRQGGVVTTWQPDRCLEEELFHELSEDAVTRLVEYAVNQWGEPLIAEHIKSASNNTTSLAKCRTATMDSALRSVLARAACSGSTWFKSVTRMEVVGRDIVGPDIMMLADSRLRTTIESVFAWAAHE